MNQWIITWIDHDGLHETTIPPCDAWNVVSNAQCQGIMPNQIIKMEMKPHEH